MREIAIVLGAAVFGLLATSQVSASPVSLEQQIERLNDTQAAFMKNGSKGGRAWGRSHNRGRHLGWSKQKRR